MNNLNVIKMKAQKEKKRSFLFYTFKEAKKLPNLNDFIFKLLSNDKDKQLIYLSFDNVNYTNN